MTAITASPVSVEFHGTAIPTFSVEGVVRVAMKPICDTIGLAWHGQHERIKRHAVLKTCVRVIRTQLPGERQHRKLLTLPLSKLNGWLFGIDTNRVKPEIRQRLVEYQAECFDVLADYWQKGEAVNPRATTIDERRPLNRAVRTLANLRSARGEAADYAGMWKLVNGYLGVAHIEDASPAQVEQAMSFVQESIDGETRRLLEGEFIERAELPSAQAEINLPRTKAWFDFPRSELYGEGCAERSALSQLIRTLERAHAEGQAVTVNNVAGAGAELLALRHHLEAGTRSASAALNDTQVEELFQLYLCVKRVCDIYDRYSLCEAMTLLGSRAGVDLHDQLRDGVRVADSLASHLKPQFEREWQARPNLRRM
ncbi:phage antirepressor N-terminal domain-containing protein [Halomonas organivorans]|uniref:Antirepressor protein ant N-terminal domain-containing protein n=1 Tax=Halomonas organivorans TaxID=257772 RepID=A0A7W5C1E2_9GAMM|nr:phage antirepressor N-terminal domain-containing protein [Halomonas organivorans]MBB3142831.1 hypothetical protein [Halomonas organivorans]